MNTVLKILVLLVIVEWACGIPLQTSDKTASNVKSPRTLPNNNLTSDEVWDYMFEKGYVVVLPLTQNEDKSEVLNDESQLSNSSDTDQNRNILTKVKNSKDALKYLTIRGYAEVIPLAENENKSDADKYASNTSQSRSFLTKTNLTSDKSEVLDDESQLSNSSDTDQNRSFMTKIKSSKDALKYLTRRGYAEVVSLAENEDKSDADKNASNTSQSRSSLTKTNLTSDKSEVLDDESQLSNSSDTDQNRSVLTKIKSSKDALKYLTRRGYAEVIPLAENEDKSDADKNASNASQSRSSLTKTNLTSDKSEVLDDESQLSNSSDTGQTRSVLTKIKSSKDALKYLTRRGYAEVISLAENEDKSDADKNASNTSQSRSSLTETHLTSDKSEVLDDESQLSNSSDTGQTRSVLTKIKSSKDALKYLTRRVMLK
ncbi:dentin sialophosphoprotein-like [Sitophilus oryzae]|uniref:Dentin sialophosphoprotein-like n=1 Tax=Sitophilus oryzae TaxID=7048 RepID=A0A6J2XCE9_SITOR|nr:dentin sialophosphoprotein-like [Sitophilus oryzae]